MRILFSYLGHQQRRRSEQRCRSKSPAVQSGQRLSIPDNNIHLVNLPLHKIVLRIQIRMFLGLPDPIPLVRGLGPAPDPTVIKKNNKKNLNCYYFVTPLWLFIFEKWCKCSFKKAKKHRRTNTKPRDQSGSLTWMAVSVSPISPELSNTRTALFESSNLCRNRA